MSKNYGAAGSLSHRGQTYLMFQRAGNMKGSSPRPSIKAAGANEHATVTLDDVKSVAFDSMPDELPSAFQKCYRCILHAVRCNLTTYKKPPRNGGPSLE